MVPEPRSWVQSWLRIIPLRVIPIYRSLYGRARVAQTGEPSEWSGSRGNLGT
jgi:hypothetical protein